MTLAMAIHDASSERLFVIAGLAAGHAIALGEDQTHYLVNVLRLKSGDSVLLFNGRDGEWQAVIREIKKRAVTVEIEQQTRPQVSGPDIDYLFAPLKRSRLDYMVQKATEMGVARLQPVITRRTIAERVNLERMRANVIEAAEQCGVLRVPDVLDAMPLEKRLAAWDENRTLIFCDETAVGRDPVAALAALGPRPLAVLIGPEGGFDRGERDSLLAKPFVRAISLGPRIMRADTAAVAALALVNATLGDWR